MEIAGKTAVVTGGARGIGAALAHCLRTAGAEVCIFDRAVTGDADPLAISCDVSDETDLARALTHATERLGRIDIFVSNAGVMSDQPGHVASASNDDWAACWSINVMAHVFAARALLPDMIAAGAGHFVIVASAAGLLNQIGDAAYSATKHAAVSFAESLAIAHRGDGIGVTLVCPQYVATPLIGLGAQDVAEQSSLLTAAAVAEAIVEAIGTDRFLVLPHPQVAGYAASRAADHDGWIDGMIRLRARSVERFGDARPERFYKLL